MVWLDPVPGRRIPRAGKGGYGYQRTPTHRHQGIDIGAPEGSPVVSPVRGTVVTVAEPGTRGFSGYGRVVVVQAENSRHWLLFAHLASAAVSVGDVVEPGTELGTVGRTCGTVEEPGKLCGGAHLHFEVAIRPYPMASEAPYRLDPTGFFLRAA